MSIRSGLRMMLVLVLASVIVVVTSPPAFALIMGGAGNEPLHDPGWPAGAAAIFNAKARIAWWEGPPFGGGEWHAECRGDAKALSAVLADFAKLDVKNKRIVLHDGVGRSFWLNPNDQEGKRKEALMDWSFTVWQAQNWERLRRLPAAMNPTDPGDAKLGPPAQIDVYTGGNIKWADVKVPKELTVVDQRLEAHGFKASDGVVVVGTITDLESKKPLQAKVKVQALEPAKTGGYTLKVVAETTADDAGHWVVKNVPGGGYRIVLEAAGFVPRVAGYVTNDGQPRWHSFNTGLGRSAVVAGRVLDDAGKPLADVTVRFDSVMGRDGRHYESAEGNRVTTDAEGRFRFDQLPEAGKASIWVYKAGYTRPGLGLPITAPKENVELRMTKAARVVVTVDFTGKQRPGGYMVHIEPEGGEAVGKYGGTGNINAQNQIVFENVPPGRYVIYGRPNPGSDKEQTESITYALKGGETTEVKLVPK